MQEFRAQHYLEALAEISDESLDLGKSAIAMAGVLHDARNLDRYIHHLNKINEDVAARHKALIDGGARDDAGTRLAALKFVLSDGCSYCLCADTDEIFDVADIIRVVDSRKGSASVIGILYMQAAHAQGWAIEGLRFPSYFLCRIEAGGQIFLFDPARQCKIMQAHDLRALVKEKLGAAAELSSDYLKPLSQREILIHVFNMIKSRQIEMGDYEAALRTLGVMRLVDPKEHRLWLDCGVLQVKTGDFAAARLNLDAFIAHAPHGRDRHEAMLLRDEIATV